MIIMLERRKDVFFVAGKTFPQNKRGWVAQCKLIYKYIYMCMYVQQNINEALTVVVALKSGLYVHSVCK